MTVGGRETAAVREGLGYAPKPTEDIERFVVVGDDVLPGWAAKLEGSPPVVQMKHFETDRPDGAWRSVWA